MNSYNTVSIHRTDIKIYTSVYIWIQKKIKRIVPRSDLIERCFVCRMHHAWTSHLTFQVYNKRWNKSGIICVREGGDCPLH